MKCFHCEDELILVHKETILKIIDNLEDGDIKEMITVLRGMTKI